MTVDAPTVETLDAEITTLREQLAGMPDRGDPAYQATLDTYAAKLSARHPEPGQPAAGPPGATHQDVDHARARGSRR